MDWKSLFEKPMQPNRHAGPMKAQWIARCHLRFAARFLPADHALREKLPPSELVFPFYLLPDIGGTDIARGHQQNLVLLAEIEEAGNVVEVRPGFWRELVRVASAMREAERADCYEERFHVALRKRAAG